MVLAKPLAKHGTVLVIVDQPTLTGGLPLAGARDMSCQIAYLPSLTIRRIADLLIAVFGAGVERSVQRGPVTVFKW